MISVTLSGFKLQYSVNEELGIDESFSPKLPMALIHNNYPLTQAMIMEQNLPRSQF